MAQPIASATVKPAATMGRYLTFVLGGEAYGIQVLKVREIIRQIDITPVPLMPDHVIGVANLRGKIIPIMDLRIKLGLALRPDDERACVVVVQVKGSQSQHLQVGIKVDAVEEVVSLAAADIEEAPNFGASLDTRYICGMAKVKGVVKTLLDIDLLLAE
jgi:purine-binding chemotaxis protein CheW